MSGTVRHDVFITAKQKAWLGGCSVWYVDATFKVAPKGMRQLFSINGFLKSKSGEIKQFPLAFAMMKRRQTPDYIAVLEVIIKSLDIVSVVEVVSDFEAAIFNAFKQCLPDVQHFGCSFHWKQAVLRKACEFGLKTQYLQQGIIL